MRFSPKRRLKTASILIALVGLQWSYPAFAESRPPFALSFMGMTVHNVEATVDFLTQCLGVRPVHTRSNWAMLSNGWVDPVVEGSLGLTWELFEASESAGIERFQAVRPSFVVQRLAALTEELRERGVPLGEPSVDGKWGPSIELVTPEGTRLLLAEDFDDPGPKDLRRPQVGWVEVQTRDHSAQVEFYSRVFGLQREARGEVVVLSQGPAAPSLRLLPSPLVVPAQTSQPGLLDVPVWVSFETTNASAAASWFEDQAVVVLQQPRFRGFGTEIVIADVDGNPIQVVDYTFSDWIRRRAHRILHRIFQRGAKRMDGLDSSEYSCR